MWWVSISFLSFWICTYVWKIVNVVKGLFVIFVNIELYQSMSFITNLNELTLFGKELVIKEATSNYLWSSDDRWRHRTSSTIAVEIACSPTEPKHYLNKCCLIMHSPESNFVRSDCELNHSQLVDYYTFKIYITSSRGQWSQTVTQHVDW